MILLPIWGRQRITKICFDNLKALQSDYNIQVMCVGSETWAKMLAFDYGFKYVHAENDCLGSKMNVGVRETLKYDYDYLMNLGSDDIITKDLFKCYDEYFKKDYPMFGGTRVTFIDSESKEVKECDYQILIGAGRCIKKSAIEDILKNGEMYDKIQRGLDLNSMNKFIRYSHVEIQNPFNTIYDIKSSTNIWGFDDLGGDKVNFDELTKGLTTKQIDQILEL